MDPVVVLGGIGSILAAVVGAGVRRVWVWGYQLAEMREDRDFWRAVALKSMGTTDKAIAKVPKMPDA